MFPREVLAFYDSLPEVEYAFEEIEYVDDEDEEHGEEGEENEEQRRYGRPPRSQRTICRVCISRITCNKIYTLYRNERHRF